MASKTEAEPAPPPPLRRGLIPFRQLKYLPVTLLLAATGVVTFTDIAFAVFSFFYAFFLSRHPFPPVPNQATPLFAPNNKLLARYVAAASVISLFLPAAYMAEGVARGDWAGIRAAGPHVFLLAAQIFMEGLTFYLGFSRPAWLFVPIGYNSRRLFSIADWLAAEFDGPGSAGRAAWRVAAGKGLAVANMGFWGFNLLGFLVPVVLPRVMKRYYAATP